METINHEYYVSLEVAKLLKEAGFDWPTLYSYDLYSTEGEMRVIDGFASICNEHNKFASMPTLEIAQRWLRVVKDYCVSVFADCDSSGIYYSVRIIYYDTNINNYYATHVWEETKLERAKHRLIFNNYEEAQEAGIKKTLEIILNKGE